MSRAGRKAVEPTPNTDPTLLVCYGASPVKRVADGAILRREDGTEAGQHRQRISDHSMLDRYRRRGTLTERQVGAGDRLAETYHLAALAPRVVANLTGTGGGEDITSSQIVARRRIRDAMKAVGIRLSPVLVHVCLLDQSAEDWAHSTRRHRKSGIEILRLALDALADHYGFEKSIDTADRSVASIP